MSGLLLCSGMPTRLIEARTAAGLSANALAQRCGLAPATVRRVELGFNVPALDTVEHLALVLGVSPAWLAFGAGSSRGGDPPSKRRSGKGGRGRYAPAAGSARQSIDVNRLHAKLTALLGVLDEQATPDSDLPKGRLGPARRLATEAFELVDGSS